MAYHVASCHSYCQLTSNTPMMWIWQAHECALIWWRTSKFLCREMVAWLCIFFSFGMSFFIKSRYETPPLFLDTFPCSSIGTYTNELPWIHTNCPTVHVDKDFNIVFFFDSEARRPWTVELFEAAQHFCLWSFPFLVWLTCRAKSFHRGWLWSRRYFSLMLLYFF